VVSGGKGGGRSEGRGGGGAGSYRRNIMAGGGFKIRPGHKQDIILRYRFATHRRQWEDKSMGLSDTLLGRANSSYLPGRDKATKKRRGGEEKLPKDSR